MCIYKFYIVPDAVMYCDTLILMNRKDKVIT